MAELRRSSAEGPGARPISIGEYQFDRDAGQLWRDGEEIRLPPRALALLAVLAERPMQVLTKRVLIERLWDGKAVGDDALTSCVQELRRALGDDPRNPKFVETRHRRGYRLLLPATAVAESSTSERPPALSPLEKASIAVLPFHNLNGDAEQEYFADGISQEVIAALSRFKSLFVIGRGRSFTYKGRTVDVGQVGRELGVRYLLQGSVRKAGNRLRIAGQLIEATSGAHLWGGHFDGALDDVFDLQDSIATSVVGAIVPRLEKAEFERARRKPVDNLDAYDLFLRGLAARAERTNEGEEEAMRLFYAAIERDPGFATPYGLAAGGYLFRRQNGRVKDKAWEEAETRRLAARVSVIGGDDALALSVAGGALLHVCQDYEGGAALIDRALSINSNDEAALRLRGWACAFMGRHEEAAESFSQALRLSPLDARIGDAQRGMAVALMFLARYKQAASWAETALASLPMDPATLRVAAAACALAGKLDQAEKIADRLCKLLPSLRVSRLKDYAPYRRQQDINLFAEGLRRAGVPK